MKLLDHELVKQVDYLWRTQMNFAASSALGLKDAAVVAVVAVAVAAVVNLDVIMRISFVDLGLGYPLD